MSKKFKVFLAVKIPDELVEYLKSHDLDVTVAKSVPVSRQELLESVTECDAVFIIPGMYQIFSLRDVS